MSTALLKPPPGAAQRISAHLQRLKARLPPPNTRPPDSNITQSPNINNPKQKSQTWFVSACDYGQSLLGQ
jgi:hypothetical protein